LARSSSKIFGSSNKVSSAPQLRFDVRRSPSLPDAVRLRLERIAGTRLTKTADRAYGRELPHAGGQSQGCHRPARPHDQAGGHRASLSHPTRPTFGAKQRRLTGKAKRGEVKRQRRAPGAISDYNR
jgi:ribosome-associated protein